MKKANIELTELQKADLERLRNQPPHEIDTSDIPEMLDWSGVERGKFYRPIKRQVTMRIDADVLEWFRDRAPNGGYQTDINRALREHVVSVERDEAA